MVVIAGIGATHHILRGTELNSSSQSLQIPRMKNHLLRCYVRYAVSWHATGITMKKATLHFP